MSAVQSILEPVKGSEAHFVADFFWLMSGLFAAVFAAVMILALFSVAKKPRPAFFQTNKFVLIAGILVPSLILISLLVFSTLKTFALRHPGDEQFNILVTGEQWWWRIHYQDHGFETANEIHIPVSSLVRLRLESTNVIHSLWIPSLAGKIDLIPGHPNEMWLQAAETGTYRGQCAEYCGIQHALMGLYLVVHSKENFQRWLQSSQKSVELPAAAKALLAKGACIGCHSIQGTFAQGLIGPDLSRIGSRLSLGAATLNNTPKQLFQWIKDPHRFKKGVAMPATNNLTDIEIQTLVDHLKELQ